MTDRTKDVEIERLNRLLDVYRKRIQDVHLIVECVSKLKTTCTDPKTVAHIRKIERDWRTWDALYG